MMLQFGVDAIRASLVALGLCACGGGGEAALSASVLAALANPQAEAQPIGVNLAEISYYGTELTFVDLFKTSDAFFSSSPDEWRVNQPLDLRPDGYPARLEPGFYASTLVLRELGGNYPRGQYLCLYDGKGKITFGLDGTKIRSKPGQITVEVKPGNAGVLLRLEETDPADPVRNIRFLPPGITSVPAQPFRKEFLDRWRGFHCLRFMDWGRTNGSKLVRWADRVLPTSQTQGSEHGVAIEYMVALVNELDCDAWVCVPHLANDDYVQQLARLLKSSLEPERKVYLEYSNEVWNYQFAQARHARDEGLRIGLSNDPTVATARFYAKRSTEVFALFRGAFQANARVVRVLASQNANPWISEQILTWQNTHSKADALAVAPYFGGEFGLPQNVDQTLLWTDDQLLTACENEIRSVLTKTQGHAVHTKRHNLRLIAYEGGQHLVGVYGAENNQRLTDKFHRVNRAAKMGTLYRQLLAGWTAAGGEMFAAFHSMGNFSKWGSWGLLEHPGQDPAQVPKYAAVRAMLGR